MATLTITVPDAIIARVLDAVRATMPETASMTDAAAGKHFIRHHVRAVVAEHEARKAAAEVQAARSAARDKAWTDTEVIT